MICLYRQGRDFTEIERGLKLLQTQAAKKKRLFDGSSDRDRKILQSLSLVINAIFTILREKEKMFTDAAEAKDDKEEAPSRSNLQYTQVIRKCVADFTDVFGSCSVIVANSSSGECCDFIETYCNGRMLPTPIVNSSKQWVFSCDDGLVNESLFLEVVFHTAVNLSSITLQGGQVTHESQHVNEVYRAQSSIGFEDSKEPKRDLYKLPCGLCVGDCDGSIEKTVQAIGDIIPWEKIIKKNSPETVSLIMHAGEVKNNCPLKNDVCNCIFFFVGMLVFKAAACAIPI